MCIVGMIHLTVYFSDYYKDTEKIPPGNVAVSSLSAFLTIYYVLGRKEIKDFVPDQIKF